MEPHGESRQHGRAIAETVTRPVGLRFRVSDDELIAEFLALRELSIPSYEILDRLSEAEFFDSLNGLWLEMTRAGFVAPVVVDGGLSWQHTKKGERLWRALWKRGLLDLEPPFDRDRER